MDQKTRRGSRRRGDRFPEGELMRLPPHSVEAEQAVLGALLLDAQAWDAVADVVTSEDFYRRDHQVIFGGIAGVVETRGPCDAVTVAEFLERKGQLEEAGGLAYIATLAALGVLSYVFVVGDVKRVVFTPKAKDAGI